MKSPFDEMQSPTREVREQYKVYERWLDRQPRELMQARRDEAEMIFRRVGITFAVYGAKDEDGSGTERLIPFDLIPRVIPKGEMGIEGRAMADYFSSSIARLSMPRATCITERLAL